MKCRHCQKEFRPNNPVHKLLVGDATAAGDVAMLMAGEKAELCLTDAPYGVGESYDGQEDTQESLAKLIAGFFPLAQQYSERILLTPGNSNQRLYPPRTGHSAGSSQRGLGVTLGALLAGNQSWLMGLTRT